MVARRRTTGTAPVRTIFQNITELTEAMAVHGRTDSIIEFNSIYSSGVPFQIRSTALLAMEAYAQANRTAHPTRNYTVDENAKSDMTNFNRMVHAVQQAERSNRFR